jgi:hypothetical protein
MNEPRDTGRGTEHIKSDNTIIGGLSGLCLIREDGARERPAMTGNPTNIPGKQEGYNLEQAERVIEGGEERFYP